MASKQMFFVGLVLATAFGIIHAEMPEEVPRRLLDTEMLKLYEATKMAQGYYGYYGSGSATAGRYSTSTLGSSLTGTTSTPRTTTTTTSTSTSTSSATGTSTTGATGTGASSASGASSAAKTATDTATAAGTTATGTTVTIKSTNGASSPVISALALILAGLMSYALAF